MSSNGVTPEEPSVKSTLNAETTTSDKKEPKGSREDISKTNGEVKPALDEFGLPIRPRRQRFVTEAEDEDGESEDGEERKDGADGAKIRSNILSGQSKGSKDQEGASSSHEPEAGAVNGHKDPAETGVGAPTQAADTTTAKQENRLRADTAGSIANGVIPLSPSPEQQFGVSEWSHQRVTIKKEEKKEQEEDEWQTMPAYAPFDMYNDDNKLIAREAVESDDEEDNGGLGGAGKGYTRVTLDEDAQSATSMDDNTAYLFKEQGTGVADEDEEERDVLSQMQATKDLLTEGQRIAYVGITRLAMIEMQEDLGSLERTRAAKKMIDHGIEAMKMWGQKMMVRLYGHMEIDPAGPSSKEWIAREMLIAAQNKS